MPIKNTNTASVIKQIDLTKISATDFKQCFVGCIILTHDNKIILQQRGDDFITFPDYVSSFGGRIEKNESPIQALVRELNEELGAIVHESDVICLGAVTEAFTNHQELVYEYFWHDMQKTITGCYEDEIKYFDTVKSVFDDPSKIMDDVRWALKACQAKRLLNE